ncbi:glycosyltransferase family 2 protein [Brevibacillus sp. TJ4]|uniref:glycosyltransferase family 2 protein n=1 Tax=Brevibacillus sp. TJ4 TaxID=3234853 RepID=UPI0037D7D560
MKVAVCILSYKRLDGLRRLLNGLEQLVFAKMPVPTVRVLVIDNDPEAGARACCELLQATYRWPLEWHHEPRRGISHGRNRAIELARERDDFLAFLDDDEVPEPGWLDHLLDVQSRYGASVVTGPVLPVLGSEAPDWSIQGGFYERPRYPTGFSMDLARTGNVLLTTALFASPANRFDERYGLSGGEDTHFFLRIRQQGHRIVWADEAIVHEWVPASRTTMSWLLQRSYRYGNTYSLCERDLQQGVLTALLRAAKGIAHIGAGIVLLVPGVFGRRVWLIKSLRSICLGAGMVNGVMGRRYEEYRQTHGS